jgi:hypothetical protein
MIDFDVKTEGFAKAMEIAKLMTLPPNLKKRYLARVGRLVIAQAKKNVKEQKTVDGFPMTPRAKTKKKIAKAEAKGKEVKLTARDTKEMLKGMVKGKIIGVRSADEYEAKVDFYRNAGMVGWKHQHGFQDKYQAYNYPGSFDVSKVQTRLNGTVASDRCTANMAATLIRLAYLPPWARDLPSGAAAKLRYVMQRVSRRQAMFLISEGKKRVSKSTHTYRIPARPFLGANDQQISQFGDEIMNSLEERFRAKQHANLMV